jgi:hypothetical protein
MTTFLPHCAVCQHWQGDTTSDKPAPCQVRTGHLSSRFSTCNQYKYPEPSEEELAAAYATYEKDGYEQWEKRVKYQQWLIED